MGYKYDSARIKVPLCYGWKRDRAEDMCILSTKGELLIKGYQQTYSKRNLGYSLSKHQSIFGTYSSVSCAYFQQPRYS